MVTTKFGIVEVFHTSIKMSGWGGRGGRGGRGEREGRGGRVSEGWGENHLVFENESIYYFKDTQNI